MPKPLFHPGRCVITPQALLALTVPPPPTSPIDLLDRHATGDWGELSPRDRLSNKSALKSGLRLMSVYPVGDETIYVITEAVDVDAGADPAIRELTTILLKSDY